MGREHQQVCRHSGAGGRIKPGNRQNSLHLEEEREKMAFFSAFAKNNSISSDCPVKGQFKVKIPSFGRLTALPLPETL
jgi:hypothetical protein